MNERIQRITEMEQLLNRLLAWNRGDKTTEKEILQEDVRRLEEYFRSSLWREDFEADEAGKLPENLPRGVLSEDGIDHLLDDNRELLERTGTIAADTANAARDT